MTKKNCRALVLFSGGLDSILAAKLLQSQNIAVTAVIFKSYFWETAQPEKTARRLKISFRTEDFSEEHLSLVKNPPHGYGKAANPCVDCHTLMLKKAKLRLLPPRGRKTKKKLHPRGERNRRWSGFNFVATGEVLGERPFSQNKKALLLIAEESGLNDRLLRPLSAKLLPPTLPEKKGWVRRDQLLDIQGRSRRHQIALAKKFGIKNYPQPAGGCLLTEPVFGQKLKKMFAQWPGCTGSDVKLLKFGRHFWEGKTLTVLGRNQEENHRLEKLAKPSDTLIIPDFPGPTALVRGKQTKNALSKTKRLMEKYS